MGSLWQDRLVTEIMRRIGQASSGGGASTLPVLAVNNDDNTVDLDLGGGQKLTGVAAQSGYIPQPGHQAVIIRNGMDLIVQPPQGPMTAPPPAATTGLVVTPGIQMLVCKWDAAPEADVKDNRGFYEIEWADDDAFTTNEGSHILAATSAVLSPLSDPTYVHVRPINSAGVRGDWSDTVQGTPATVPVTLPADGSITEAMLADAAVTAAKLAQGAVDNLALADDAVESNNIAAGAVTADSIQAGAVGAAAIAAYSIDTNKLAAGSVTASALAAGSVTTDALAANSVTASILDANAINGKQITGSGIQTSADDPAVRLGPDTEYEGYPALELTDSSGKAAYFTNQNNVLNLDVDGITFFTANANSESMLFPLPLYTESDLYVYGQITQNGQSVWAQDSLYVVQVAFYADGTNRFFSVSYSCPFSPTKCVATSNTGGAVVNSVSSIGQYGCSVQISDVTGGVSAYGLRYVTLMLS